MPLMLDPGSPSSSSTSSKRLSHFTIGSVSVDDVRRIVDIEFHAFEDERTNQQLSFRDYQKPEHFERSVNIYTNILTAAQRRDTGLGGKQAQVYCDEALRHNYVKFYKVEDTESEDVVSFAKMEVKTYTVDELLSPADTGHEREPKMNRDWFALNERMRRSYVGLTKHCYIAMLATEPCYQHNGAGTMLLKTMLSEADDAGIEVYLEGTDTAKALYEKHGFVAVNEIRFDPAEYGQHDIGKERQTIMVRGALAKNGARRDVRAWSLAAAQAQAECKANIGSR
ncbi:hypothetical protein BAUCODRAFT_149820 [Baudoinia panamericana UAMH 10762]|uniref:N-acetyltransferase domain-containing protein n=1 Tax=Baudoinia panamericana (strain UAMH 10762) TaxID=717646 RepID=M2LKC1_BAUPA|nr:uncharacterized protein BAUCODRAFT_149820 [Baudoinia panamericana UAMH 10762]EMC94712.1 hypothetical protein BAUCODRAFT_149820 [Baudoinia panamericana UAMH 10762]